ncbi:uncharacterized [Tachysurus ichikawai]
MATADVSSEQIPHSAAFEELLEVLTHAVAYISNSSLISTLRGQELGEIQYTPFQRQTIFFVVLREHGCMQRQVRLVCSSTWTTARAINTVLPATKQTAHDIGCSTALLGQRRGTKEGGFFLDDPIFPSGLFGNALNTFDNRY